MAANMAIDSPRLLRLLADLQGGAQGILDTFWHEIAELGTPLVEPVPADPHQVLVTFLWRAHGPLDNVLLISDLARGYFWNSFAQGKLIRLPGTDVWFRTYRVRADARFLYCLSPNDPLIHPDDVRDWDARRATWQPDPLNPRRFVFPDDEAFPDRAQVVRSVVELPDAPAPTWAAARPGVPAGTVQVHHVRSAILGNQRRVWVYTPPGYDSGRDACGLLLLFDGWDYLKMIPTPTILDNLTAAGRLPPLVAVLTDTKVDRGRDLNGHPPFLDFVVRELLPWVRGNYRVADDPARRIVGGLSLGGVAAAAVGLRNPETFGNVLAQAGAFWTGRPGDAEWEWVARAFAASERLPLRFALNVGLLEDPRDVKHPTLLCANRHLRTVLRAKGYEVHYTEFNGGHEHLNWQAAMPGSLLYLIGRNGHW